MTYETHPAFRTSFENREMFGWAQVSSMNEPKKPQAKSHSERVHEFTLMLDGCLKFTFVPDGNQVIWKRQARNGYKNGAWQVTGRDTLSIEEGRKQYKRLVKLGAVKV